MENVQSERDSSVFLDVWARCLSTLEREFDPQVFAAYIKPLQVASIDSGSGEVVVYAPSRFVCNHVDREFKLKLADLLALGLGVNSIRLRFAVPESSIEQTNRPIPVVIKKVRLPARVEPAAESQQLLEEFPSPPLNQKYTFESFVVGSSNQFCHAAAMRVAERPGHSYNPLFIYGGVGLGKTHLLHAIGNTVLARNPKAKVLYMSSETFTNELIQALRHGKMNEFKNRMRSVEVLLIDDIQFMCGKERTQEEFFHTFNALYDAKHQIVITSDKLPQEIPGIEERLQTRFSWGLAADLQAPDFETRVAILKHKASVDLFQIPEDVAHLISEKISSNVRELEGALTRLHAVSSLQHADITIDMAKTALRHILQPKTVTVSADDIKREVSEHFGIKVSDMISKRRTKNLSFPRHIAMYLCRKHTTCSYPDIGARFGGRDHSSVIHAANVVSAKIGADDRVRLIVGEIEKRLFGN
jgi:chromosomal replication initiator protein